MTVREPVRQEHPFRGLADAVKDQHERTVTQTRGTMLGFKGPDVFQGLSVADLHLHYLDDDRAFGGHVLDFDLIEATLSVEVYAGFNLRLPEVDSYLIAHLDHMDSDSIIRRVTSLTQRRLTDPAAVIAGLPADTRPAPSVAGHDELLTLRRSSIDPSKLQKESAS